METATSYVCNYCGVEHDLPTRSVEHIVPRKLFNSSLVLRDVCSFWNNFFARAFETEACSSEFVREILMELTPRSARPKGEVFLGTVETSRQTTETRWLVDGEEVLRDLPTRQATDVLTMDAFDDRGGRYGVHIRLPFAFTTGGFGDEHAAARLRERLKKEQRRIAEYIGRLVRDPTLDPVLCAHLQAEGLHLREPKAVEVEENHLSHTPGGPVADILPKEYVVDSILWTKLYMKIAWCFACAKLGRDVLVGLDGDGVLGYLQGDAVPLSLVEGVRELDLPSIDVFFREASISGRSVWIWSGSATKNVANLESVPRPVAALLSPILAQRVATEELAGTWVRMVPATLTRPFADEQRRHTLVLRTEVRGSRAALVCDIALFGGLLAATVQLTPALPAADLEGFVDVSETLRF